jgi:deoxyribonuclease V
MIVAVDVDYRATEVVAAAVGFTAWTDEHAALEVVVTSDAPPAPYEPGQFYRRELPHIQSVLALIAPPLTAIVVDGYAWLGPNRGLGAHLYDALEHAAAVIGVAKTQFAGATAVEVIRGTSTRPLYITAAGIDAAEAAAHVLSMHGEHRVPAGQISPYRPALWVPIIVAGRHPRLAPGRHDGLASLLDVTPTLADLLGVREPVPWQGHSLLDPDKGRIFAFALESMRVGETRGWTALAIEGGERPALFDRAGDWTQRRDVASALPWIAAALALRAERRQRLNDYLLRHDLVWKRDAAASEPGQAPNL